MAKKKSFAVKSAVRGLASSMRISGDFWKSLDERIEWKVKRAALRAKANGRKTIRGSDL